MRRRFLVPTLAGGVLLFAHLFLGPATQSVHAQQCWQCKQVTACDPNHRAGGCGCEVVCGLICTCTISGFCANFECIDAPESAQLSSAIESSTTWAQPKAIKILQEEISSISPTFGSFIETFARGRRNPKNSKVTEMIIRSGRAEGKFGKPGSQQKIEWTLNVKVEPNQAIWTFQTDGQTLENDSSHADKLEIIVQQQKISWALYQGRTTLRTGQFVVPSS